MSAKLSISKRPLYALNISEMLEIKVQRMGDKKLSVWLQYGVLVVSESDVSKLGERNNGHLQNWASRNQPTNNKQICSLRLEIPF